MITALSDWVNFYKFLNEKNLLGDYFQCGTAQWVSELKLFTLLDRDSEIAASV